MTNASKNGKKIRKRNITWFNPPFSKHVATNLGAKFLKLIEKSFPKEHTLNQIFNRNTLKLSYKCMPNMQRIISAHNSKILREEEQRKKQQQSQEQNQQPVKRRGRKKKQPPVDGPGCGCQAGVQACPMRGQCKVESIAYRAKVTEENGNIETYTGLTSNTFKKRYYKHNSDFNNRESKGTTLSTLIWKFKMKTNIST